MSVIQEHFMKTFDADETWETKAGDMDKEIKLIKERKNDLFPQGRDNCKKFLRECKEKGFDIKIKAKKTKPYWTWYYEVAQPAIVTMTLAGLPDFCKDHESDQAWDGRPDSVEKELGLVDKRKDDKYPQGRDEVKKFLGLCKEKGYNFKIKAKKTKPHWTWFFEVVA